MTSCSSALCNRPMIWQLSTWELSSPADSRCRRWRRDGTLSSMTHRYQSKEEMCLYCDSSGDCHPSSSLLFPPPSPPSLPSIPLPPSVLPFLCPSFSLLLFIPSSLSSSLPPSPPSLPSSLPPSPPGWLWRPCVPCILVWSLWL